MSWLHLVFFISMAALVTIGAMCAVKLDHRNPLWVRLVVLSPCLVALYTSYRLVTEQYVPYPEDVFFYWALALNYSLIYSRFTGRPWLDLRTREWLIEQQHYQSK